MTENIMNEVHGMQRENFLSNSKSKTYTNTLKAGKTDGKNDSLDFFLYQAENQDPENMELQELNQLI